MKMTRIITPKPNQIAVFTMLDASPESRAEIERKMQEFASEHQMQVILLFPGQTLYMLDEEDMRRAGWMRIPKPDAIGEAN